MLFLILFLIIGLLVVYISRFNFSPVTVNLGFYTFPDIPLFYVIIGSLLVGLVLSYLVYLIRSISTSFAFHGKDKEIKKEKDKVFELTKRIHQLESENEKLRRDVRDLSKDPNSS